MRKVTVEPTTEVEGTLTLTVEFESVALDTRSSHEEAFPYLSFAVQ